MKLSESEYSIMEIIWAKKAPVTSQDICALSDQRGWKAPTVLTFLKRLCEKGIFCNENGTVQSLMSREEFNAAQSEQFVESTFGGSLPAFIASFTKRKQLSDSELAEIQKMISQMGEK